MSDDDDEPPIEPEPLLEISVTVWNEDDELLTAVVHMGSHEIARITGKDLRDLLVAAGKTLPRIA